MLRLDYLIAMVHANDVLCNSLRRTEVITLTAIIFDTLTDLVY